MEWKPVRVVFTDEDFVRALMSTPDDDRLRGGNLWTAFRNLPRPERERLEAEAAKRRDSK